MNKFSIRSRRPLVGHDFDFSIAKEQKHLSTNRKPNWRLSRSNQHTQATPETIED